MKNKKISYQVYVGSALKSHSADHGQEAKEYWRLSKENPSKAVFFTKTEVIATNAMANIVIKQQAIH